MVKLEKCELCLTWTYAQNVTSTLDNTDTPRRTHKRIEFCVAALAERAGDESIDDAVMRLFGCRVPIDSIDFPGKEERIAG